MTPKPDSIASSALAVLGLLMLCVPPAAGAVPEETWIVAATPNFELYTSAGERRGRDTILYLEMVRSFFRDAVVLVPRTNRPVRFVGFSSEEEFKPYASGKGSAAFYVSAPESDCIVTRGISVDQYPTAIHEYVHLLMKRAGVKAPVWWEEGTADLFATSKPRGKKIQIGDIIPGYHQLLLNATWLDLDTLLQVDRDSSHYDEATRAGMFYAQSWALVHMLNLSQTYVPKLPEFLKGITDGVSGLELFAKVDGKAPGQVHEDLRNYLNSRLLTAALFDVKLEKSAESPLVRALSPMEAGITLADLLRLTGRKEEARHRLEQLAGQFKDAWQVEQGLAYHHLYEGEDIEAVRHFTRAAELGCTNPKMFFDHAMVRRRSDGGPAQAIPLLREALQLQSDYKEARLQLGFLLVDDGRPGEAIESFSGLRIEPYEAFRVFHVMAYAYAKLGDMENVKRCLERARPYASSPPQISMLDELSRWIEAGGKDRLELPRDLEDPAPGAATVPADAPSPISTSGDAETESQPPYNPFYTSAPHYIEGELYQVDCLGKAARLHIRSEDKTTTLAILDPARILIQGRDTDKIALQCGPHKPTRMLVGYELSEDKELGTIGIIRGIEYK